MIFYHSFYGYFDEFGMGQMMGFVTHRMIEQGKDDDGMMDDDIMASVLVVPVCQWPGTRAPDDVTPWCVYTWSPQINTCTAAQHSPHTNDAPLFWGMGWCQMMDNVLEPSSGWRLYKEASTGCIYWTLTRPPGFYLGFLANTKRGSGIFWRTRRVVWCLNVYD